MIPPANDNTRQVSYKVLGDAASDLSEGCEGVMPPETDVTDLGSTFLFVSIAQITRDKP